MTADVRMKGFSKRTAVAEAWALIEARVRRLPPERVPFRAALGRVLAADVHADRDVPPHPRAAMDGYAVRARDLPGSLVVVGELLAAATPTRGVGEGEALRIMTGARIPPGADAVVMVEDTTVEGNRVRIAGDAAPGQHVLATGEDLRAGTPAVRAGRILQPRHVALLATVGCLDVPVVRRPTVRIIPTGSELIPPGRAPVGSEVVESNGYLLEGLALRDGGRPEVHPIVPDDPDLLAAAIAAPGADVVVVTGGSSVGREDNAPGVVRALGELAIHGLAAKPASPAGLGFVGESVVVLAPGYPVAAHVAWDLLARPAVQRLAGLPVAWPYRRAPVRLAAALSKPAARLELLRATLEDTPDGPPLARVIPGGAALLSTLGRADALLLLEPGRAQLDAGEHLDALLLD